ncbi:DUF3852 domain-containing protein [Oscillospiraceae bacterium OttesenSCG-928-F05]|nr:DUF3852 domain-containing protein [Oscillospiraceae bacterium OttesenSCG-928-F05]
MKHRKILAMLCLVVILCAVFATPALASSVSSAIEATWKDAAGQVKTIVNSVVFPAISLILAVLFFVKLATAWMDYRKHGQFEFAGPAILFVGLILALTAPLYLWTILGI